MVQFVQAMRVRPTAIALLLISIIVGVWLAIRPSATPNSIPTDALTNAATFHAQSFDDEISETNGWRAFVHSRLHTRSTGTNTHGSNVFQLIASGDIDTHLTDEQLAD